MKCLLQFATIAVVTTAWAASAEAQSVNDEPLNQKWAPSEWGADDKVGAPNRTTPELVLKAVGLVKQGKVATLGKVYASDAPAFGSRSWKLVIPGRPTGGPFGGQQLVYNDEYVSTEIGQIGTQFDGPGHIGVITSKGMFYYNGRYLHDKGVGSEGMGAARRRARRRRRASCAAACCSMRSPCAAASCPCRRRTAPATPASSPPRTWRRWSSARASPPSAPATACSSTPATATSGIPRTGTPTTRPRRRKRVAPVQRRRAGLRHLGLRVSGRAQDHPHRCRHLGRRGGRQGRRRRDPAALRVPHQAADQARHLEPREHGPVATGRRPGLRVPVRVVAAEDEGRDRLARQPGGAVLASADVRHCASPECRGGPSGPPSAILW